SVWDDPHLYVDLSAVFKLRHVRTPVLLANGDKDACCLLNAIEMYNGLRQLGVDVTLLRYPDQAHGLTGRPLEDFWSRERAFFQFHLRPERSGQAAARSAPTLPLRAHISTAMQASRGK